MSTKTLLKRFAFGTAVAVTAGTLSLVSTTAAHAALSGNTTNTAGDIASIAGTGIVGPLAGTSNISLTATVLSTGSLVVATASDVAHAGYYTVSSGAYVAAAGGSGAINSSQSAFTPAAANETFTVGINGAASSTFQVVGYTTTSKTAVESVLTVTIAGTSVAGTPSAAKSTVAWVPVNTAGTVDASGASTGVQSTNGTPAKVYLQVQLADAYGVAVLASKGVLTVTASTGANVNTATGSGGSANTSPSAGSYSTAVNTDGYSTINVAVSEATAGAGWNGTVTVSFNGNVLATKSGVILGYVSKVLIAPVAVVNKNGSATLDALSYNAYDAAGNVETLSTNIATASSDAPAVIAASGSVAFDSAAYNNTSSAGAIGYLNVTGISAGSSNIAVKYTRPDGAVVTSNTAKVNVGGNADSYTAAFDKSSYNQGDIATLKISFKDSKGNAAASNSMVYADNGATVHGWNASLTAPMLTQVGSLGTSGASAIPTTYDATGSISTDQNGVITIKYTVGTPSGLTAGSYNAVVDFPTVDSADGAAQTVAYSVGNGGTSLNDVLKGIVSLIASINKQIAALAKLVAPAKKK
jgi:hypothetical protein